MGARSRRKGATWERDVRDLFRAAGFTNAERGAQQSRAGDAMADVEGTPWWVEAKVGQRIDVIGALRQAEAATDGRPVLAVCKRNAATGKGGPEVFVSMRWEEFARLLGGPPSASGGSGGGGGEVPPDPRQHAGLLSPAPQRCR